MDGDLVVRCSFPGLVKISQVCVVGSFYLHDWPSVLHWCSSLPLFLTPFDFGFGWSSQARRRGIHASSAPVCNKEGLWKDLWFTMLAIWGSIDVWFRNSWQAWSSKMATLGGCIFRCVVLDIFGP